MSIVSPNPDSKLDPPRCHGDRDGECFWSRCPQLCDGEPEATGRHCPLDVFYDDWNEPNPDDVARRDAYLAQRTV